MDMDTNFTSHRLCTAYGYGVKSRHSFNDIFYLYENDPNDDVYYGGAFKYFFRLIISVLYDFIFNLIDKLV